MDLDKSSSPHPCSRAHDGSRGHLVARVPADDLAAVLGPLLTSPDPALFCIADQVQYANIQLRDAGDPQKEITLPDTMVTVIIDDLNSGEHRRDLALV